jgi:poly(3-hydroxybutyrate) depolymerase
MAGCLLLSATTSICGRAQEPLIPYGAGITETSVSGISSGAFMAVQFAVAWSSVVKGVGAIRRRALFLRPGNAGRTVLSGGGALSALTALNQCMANQPGPDVPTLIGFTDQFVQDGTIDNTANIAHQKIYVFSGYNDNVVLQGAASTLPIYFAHYLTKRNIANLYYQDAVGAGHSQVVAGYGGACEANGGEYINDCAYDQAGIILQHIYGRLQPKNSSGTPMGSVIAFTQRDFVGGGVVPPKTYGMAEAGYAYVPSSCATVRCRVHVALHGCLQNAEMIGQDYILHAGYNEWADTNGIIVVYPQTTATNLNAPLVIDDPTAPINPKGCWDWWGYTDSNYATQQGEQIGAIKAMLDRLSGGPGPAAAMPGATTGLAVTGLEAIDASDTAIDLVWWPVQGATAYDVYRKGAADTDFVLLGSVSGPSFGDAGLDAQTAYQYAVGVSGKGTPDFSSAVNVTTRATPPKCADPGKCPVR